MSSPLDKLPAVCRHLTAQRVLAEPVSVSFDEDTQVLAIDTGTDLLHVVVTTGDPMWLVSAHRLGGLLVRVAPATSPDHVSVFAQWEAQSTALSCQVL